MQDVEILHREAMELVDQAMNARLQGDTITALELTKAAFFKEQAAANLVANSFELEPTRSILHRSAATLAVECSFLREAEKLIGRMKSG
jgi:hypothetical protein